MTDDASTPHASPPLGGSKIGLEHVDRLAIVYVRQSTAQQVEKNQESQRLQYKLADRARAFGWAADRVRIIDEDLGKSGATSQSRTGFQTLVGQVAMNQVGLVLGLEVSRLARNNKDWYQLLDLCAVFGTLIGDADGIYDPRSFNDRLLLGLKGTMSEAELHVLRGRLEAGRRNKARRGEFTKPVPVGYHVTADGKVIKNPNELVQHAISGVFALFRELGSVSAVLTRLREDGIRLPHQSDPYGRAEVEWGLPTYRRIHAVVTNPIYAGAYAYGRTQTVTRATPDGRLEQRSHVRLQVEEWTALIKEHHAAYISWAEYDANQARLRSNLRGFMGPGPIHNGSSLLAGLVRCGACGRKMRVSYTGVNRDAPRFTCPGTVMGEEGERCQTFGARRFEDAVGGLVVAVLEPDAIAAALTALGDYDQQRTREERRLRLEVEKAEHTARVAERRYQSVDPENRLVARQLEADWEAAMLSLEEAKRGEERRRTALPPPLSEDEKQRLRESLDDLPRLWRAPTTAPADRKEIVRILIANVVATRRAESRRLTYEVRWTTGHVTRGFVQLPRTGEHRWCTDDDAVAVIRRLLPDHTAGQTASVLTKLGKRTGHGLRWTAARVQSVRVSQSMGKPEEPPQDHITIRETMRILGADHRTVRSWVAAGRLLAKQAYPHARWHISRASVERVAKERGTTT